MSLVSRNHSVKYNIVNESAKMNARASGRSIPGCENIENEKIRGALMGVYVDSETITLGVIHFR